MPEVDAAARLSVLDRVMADPPNVHPGSNVGVWLTDRRCYELMARTLPESAATLETGLGLSTVLLASWGCRHTCVVGDQAEVDGLTAYCADRSIDLTAVSFEVGRSEDVLPGLDLGAVDLVLIDGGHGFPTPVIDWFYGCRTLNVGGVVVVDDMQLPSVADYLGRYLELDPSWLSVAREPKWAAFRRTSAAALGGEWTTQSEFLGGPRVSLANRAKIAGAKVLERTKLGRDLLRARGT